MTMITMELMTSTMHFLLMLQNLKISMAMGLEIMQTRMMIMTGQSILMMPSHMTLVNKPILMEMF